MKRTATFVTVLSLLAAGSVVTKSATAAAPRVAGYAGEHASSVAGCPYIIWRLARHDNGEITGIVYYSDMTGVSTANGTIDQAGKFHLSMVSSMGSGPVGTVDGTRSSEGKVSAVMKGAGCANMQLSITPVRDLNVPMASKEG